MGLFRKKKEPVHVGRSVSVLDADNVIHVDTQWLPKVTREYIATLAPITLAVHLAHSTAGTPDHTQMLEQIREGFDIWADMSALNKKYNPQGVALRDSTKSPQIVAGSVGEIRIHPDNFVTGTWAFTEVTDVLGTGMRFLAALWQVAEWAGGGREVQFALDMLTSADVDWVNPDVEHKLPLMLLDYGVQQAEIDGYRRLSD